MPAVKGLRVLCQSKVEVEVRPGKYDDVNIVINCVTVDFSEVAQVL